MTFEVALQFIAPELHNAVVTQLLLAVIVEIPMPN